MCEFLLALVLVRVVLELVDHLDHDVMLDLGDLSVEPEKARELGVPVVVVESGGGSGDGGDGEDSGLSHGLAPF